mmetsp:Transcript_40560/g.100207  ORF Transcript_40560/g.100207 Transcript_40560/m.100207 type:complete len:209 (+) Transcript_40560:221-847(+)
MELTPRRAARRCSSETPTGDVSLLPLCASATASTAESTKAAGFVGMEAAARDACNRTHAARAASKPRRALRARVAHCSVTAAVARAAAARATPSTRRFSAEVRACSCTDTAASWGRAPSGASAEAVGWLVVASGCVACVSGGPFACAADCSLSAVRCANGPPAASTDSPSPYLFRSSRSFASIDCRAACSNAAEPACSSAVEPPSWID